MARLHEYQGKDLLRQAGIAVPDGSAARTADEARAIAAEIGERVVIKVQAWTTSRAAQGGIVFAENRKEAEDAAAALLGRTFGNFPVREVLVERAIDIAHEMFISLSIDDAARSPVLLLDPHGGSGIEERAATVARIPVDIHRGIDEEEVQRVLESSTIEQAHHDAIIESITKIIDLAKSTEARSFEVNPLVISGQKVGGQNEIVAADCRVTIDDYAVFRHPELGIEIARELDHPPTQLEKIAYRVEEADHRGTFYFAQLAAIGDSAVGIREENANASRLIGFHGAGGGGSMMSMDAITNAGFTIANFCDTSGNPSAAKVYRAARIILSQPGLIGYFGSGSGVASQEQFWSAYGLAKAFNEVELAVPAVIRLGGNSEDRAVEILEDACKDLPGKVEGYKKDDTPQFCAERFAELVNQSRGREVSTAERVPGFVESPGAYSFPIKGGRVWIDQESCDEDTTNLVIEHSSGLLQPDERGKPVLAVSEEEAAGKDSEMIACEVECLRAGKRVVFVDLPVRGLSSRVS